MDSEKLTRNYYSKLIRLPSTEALSIWVGAEVGLSFLRSLSDGFTYLTGFLVYLSLSLISLHRRVRTFLAMAGMFGIIYLIISFFPLVIPLSFGLFIPLMTYVMLIDYGDFTSPGLTTLIGLISALSTFPRNIELVIAFYLIVGLFSYLYLILVNRKGKSVTGIPSLNIVRPFLKAMSYRRDEEVENFLEKISTEFHSSTLVLKLGDVLLVLPRIHFGMYGKVGSSLFPYQLEELVNNKVMVFHGPGSHEIDLASSKESRKLAQIISSKIREGNWKELRFGGIKFLSEDRFRMTSLVFDHITLNFSERPGYGIDDLPGGLWDESLKTGNFLVDCHNESLKEEIGHRDERALREFVSKKIPATEERPLLVGYGESEINSTCEGICSRKVKALIVGDGDKKIVIAYVFANNANEETGKLLREKFGNLYEKVILVTPDDHSCTGTSFGNLYTPAEPCPQILEALEKAIKNAEANLKKVEASYMIVDAKVKVIGKFISLMVEGLEQVGSFAMRTFWIPVIFPYVALIILLLGNYLVKF
ncbi:MULTISPECIES: DUF2070 family protein [Metallosphaera]|uniref:DUF2070 family protein n=1 Tax=Metallosphaera TaxID=41980 RepID=UPI001F06900C|nr:DUF2070 family protein [Metallosphaera sedula]MCH1771678.1 DUF2070 family protein [Metallosphaera sedula]MCP6728277.1 DUF2070 family protein [Metallosphaera sedula]